MNNIAEKIKELNSKPNIVKNVLAEGGEKARAVADETMDEVKEVMGLELGK